jgi:DNA-binding CsgD family transcriptional regulator
MPPAILAAERPHDTGAADSPALPGSALVVEDDAGWNAILSELLADAGYAVHSCHSFGEALGRLRRTPYALAVIDLALDGSTTAMWPPADITDQEGTNCSKFAGARHSNYRVSARRPRRRCARYRDTVFRLPRKADFPPQHFYRLCATCAPPRFPLTRLQLSPTRAQVLNLLAAVLTNNEIAAGLFIHQNTVKRHLRAIFEKLDVHTRSAAAIKAAAPAWAINVSFAENVNCCIK